MANIGEAVPLLPRARDRDGRVLVGLRGHLQAFLEAKTRPGLFFEAFIVLVILVNVLSYVLSTESVLFEKYQNVFDVIETVTVIIFTIEYVLRFYASGELRRNRGLKGRLWYIFSFFSLIDLASIIPYYVDLALPGDVISSTCFIRLFRLFRNMATEGRYLDAFLSFSQVVGGSRKLLVTSGFLTLTTWVILSSLFYMAERSNKAMDVYADAPGFINNNSTDGTFLYNRYENIVISSYYTLVNLFGEFPNADDHTDWGKVLGTFTTVVAAGVVGVFAGILGGGFSDLLEKRRDAKKQQQQEEEEHGDGGEEDEAELNAAVVQKQLGSNGNGSNSGGGGDCGDDSLQDRLYRFLHAQTPAGLYFEYFIFALIISNVVCFMVGTVKAYEPLTREGSGALWYFELVSVVIFTLEYVLRFYAAGRDPRYAGLRGRVRFIFTFYSLVDLASVVPFYISFAVAGDQRGSTFVRALRLLRMFKGEAYIEAFTVFDDVLRDNSDVLAVTGFTAVVTWVFASTLMYYAERNSPIEGIRVYYQSVGSAMWITLLNLTGEVPLADYSAWGKLINAIVGVFAVSFFTIPIGILGSGFEDWVADDKEEEGKEKRVSDQEGERGASQLDEDALAAANKHETASLCSRVSATPSEREMERLLHQPADEAMSMRRRIFEFIKGKTLAGGCFVFVITVLIVLICVESMLTTVEAYSGPNVYFDWFEGVAVVIFTIEYLLRFYAAPEDPAFNSDTEMSRCLGTSDTSRRLQFVTTLFSVIDLLAIVPWYVAEAGVQLADDVDELLRMLRLLRLLSLDRYVPSISLIDDVIRAQKTPLIVTSFVSMVLWVIFATLLYLTEVDNDNPVEDGDLSMASRFANVPNALQYTLILLTGDYPLTEFTFWGRAINFFMVVAAVGVVGIPTGLICSGFTDIIEERSQDGENESEQGTDGGDEFVRGKRRHAVAPALNTSYERRQQATWDFLDAKTPAGWWTMHGILVLILLNVLAVILESIESVEVAVGSMAWDVFEAASVVIFTIEYLVRLWCVVRDPGHNYSRAVYAFGFFGLCDLIAIAPYFVEQVLTVEGVVFDSTVFRVLRMFRIFQLEHFLEAFTLLDDVYRQCEKVLKATGLLALVIWVGGATLFYLTEHNTDDRFRNIPNSLFYVAVFLGGEWAHADFTDAGKVLCCIFCILGIGLFSLPIGFLFDAFGDVIGDEEEEMTTGGEGGAEEGGKNGRNVMPETGAENVHHHAFGAASPIARSISGSSARSIVSSGDNGVSINQTPSFHIGTPSLLASSGDKSSHLAHV